MYIVGVSYLVKKMITDPTTSIKSKVIYVHILSFLVTLLMFLLIFFFFDFGLSVSSIFYILNYRATWCAKLSLDTKYYLMNKLLPSMTLARLLEFGSSLLCHTVCTTFTFLILKYRVSINHQYSLKIDLNFIALNICDKV